MDQAGSEARDAYSQIVVGSRRRAYLGLVTSPAALPPAWVERTGQHTALAVADVVPGSPAAGSGLRGGDLVLAVDGTPLGRRTEITVLRNSAGRRRHRAHRADRLNQLRRARPGSPNSG